MHAKVQSLQSKFPSCTIVPGNVFVLNCEVRQGINKYGLNGMKFLCELYGRSKNVRSAVEALRTELMSDDFCAQSHTIQILQCVVKTAGYTIQQVRQASPRQAQPGQIVDLCAEHKLCPKFV